MISYALIESVVYQTLEINREEIYQYARKEIIFNERDMLHKVIKKTHKFNNMPLNNLAIP